MANASSSDAARKVQLGAVAAGVLLLGLLGALLFVDFQDPPKLLLFLGRFHPLLVHFPIGLLFLAGLLEGISALSPRFSTQRPTLLFVLACGAGMSLLAAGAGFLLSLEGGYEGSLLFWHRWLGSLVAAGSCLAVVLKWKQEENGVARRVYPAVLGVVLASLVAAGHFGGTLAHGPDYLTYYLPGPLRTLLGIQRSGAPWSRTIPDLSSAGIFSDLIDPILQSRCTDCHNESKKKGGLRLDTPQGLLKGGESGPVLVPGRPEESEILRRTTLPLYHEERMPPQGQDPLSVGETELLRWWIAQGASLEMKVSEAREVPSSVQTLLNRLKAPQSPQRRGIFALKVPRAPEGALERVRSRGVEVQPLSRNEPFLDVQCSHLGAEFQDAHLQDLVPLSRQITWLDLSGTGVTDEGLSVIAGMANLTRLNLAHTPVSGSGLHHLGKLKYLEYLNLYGTRVDDESVQTLAALESLQALYLWQTRVTAEGIERLRQARSKLAINTGSALETVSTDPSPASHP